MQILLTGIRASCITNSPDVNASEYLREVSDFNWMEKVITEGNVYLDLYAGIDRYPAEVINNHYVYPLM